MMGIIHDDNSLRLGHLFIVVVETVSSQLDHLSTAW